MTTHRALVLVPLAGSPFEPTAIHASNIRHSVGRAATLVVKDPQVSRNHAELEYRPTGWHITDLASLNGTFVDGVAVETAMLSNGTEIRLGPSCRVAVWAAD